jgi:hypothetical protein
VLLVAPADLEETEAKFGQVAADRVVNGRWRDAGAPTMRAV